MFSQIIHLISLIDYYHLQLIGICKCRNGCTFFKDPIGCFLTLSSQYCKEFSHSAEEVACTCDPLSMLSKDDPRAYHPCNQLPCPKGFEAHFDEKVGVCKVYTITIKSLILLYDSWIKISEAVLWQQKSRVLFRKWFLAGGQIIFIWQVNFYFWQIMETYYKLTL